jgi:hypothetical protein
MRVDYTDKQRVWLTGATYQVHSTAVSGNANDAPLSLSAPGRYRLVRIGRNGAGSPTTPGSDGSGAVPTVALANDIAGYVFDPFTGIWSPPAT